MRRNDLIGRCIAEQFNPDVVQCAAVDLTYSDDPNTGVSPPGAMVLMYSHIEKFLKRLRDGDRTRQNGRREKKRGVRFLVAGELGSRKGRAHWHCILFFTGERQVLPPYSNRVNWSMWPHGFSWIKPVDYRTILYAVKYALKPVDEIAQYGYSKKANYSRYPPLGTAFFEDRADTMVRQRLAVWDNEYTFGHVKDRHGRARKFYLRNTSLRLFLSRYVEGWHSAYGGLPPMTDFLVENYFDPLAAAERLADPAAVLAELERKRGRDALVRSTGGVGVPMPAPPKVWSRRHVATLFLGEGLRERTGVACAYSDGVVAVHLGDGEGVRLNARAGEALEAEAWRLGLPADVRLALVEWIGSRVVPLLDPAGVEYAGDLFENLID